MADFDPMEYLEYEDAQYEDMYADEFEDIHDIEEEEIDFNDFMKSKKRTDLKKPDISGTTETKNDDSQKETFQKRTCSEMLDLPSGLTEHTEEKENVAPRGGSLKPKRLRLDDDVDFDIDWGLEATPGANVMKEVTKTINQLKASNDSFDDNSYQQTRQRVFKRPVFGSNELMNITNTDGDRVFLKLCSEDEIPTVEEKRWQTNSSSSGLNLLSVPFDQLKSEVQERIHQLRIMGGLNAEDEEEAENRTNRPETTGNHGGELWVEKYTPKRYTELLSDDGTNRYVLKWLKLWDKVVFGIEPPKEKEKESGPDALDAKGNNNPAGNKGGKGFQKFEKKFYHPEDDLVRDVKGRPKKKLVLLCGNPGLGKTTLAHVISKHAGYQVIEMNASDDRSPEVFLNKIETSTQMKAVIGQTKKPNCLVIDEIDGAPVQAINILLDLVKNTESYGGKAVAKGTKKKKKKKDMVLNRPIICICNDQFVPALRQLRQVAFTLKFPPTLPSRLAGRLLAISQKESLRIDMTALLQLAEKTENDIRSCLNTLQFIQQKKKEFRPEDLKNVDIGRKDMKKGVQLILTEVFQLPKMNKKRTMEKYSSGGDVKSSLTNRFHYMLHLVQGNSEFDKMTQGLFDQYLHCKTKDPYLESINEGCEWIAFTDLLKKRVASNQDYVLWKFLSFLPVAFHMYFARANSGKVQYCNATYENFMKLSNNVHTVDLLTGGMTPTLRRYCSTNVMTIDLLPYLFSITLPNLRPVNTKLFSESEKQVFSSLVSTLISYNLTYKQERNLEGQYTYVLEPNIEELVVFPGLPQRRQLLYATKQLIAREVEMEKMRQSEQVIKSSETVNEKPGTSGSQKTDIVAKQKLVPKKFGKVLDRPQVDFFGRVVKTDNAVKEAPVAKKKNEVDEGKISLVMNTKTWFRFNEGYTNAVRRTIKMPEFL